MTCPYCNARDIVLTLTNDDGTYSMCDVCSVAWGVKANAAEARDQVSKLEYAWSLPTVEEREVRR